MAVGIVMEWRCEWCGKPQPADDPPCDACGHGSFEKAVVQVPESVETGPTYVWRCTSCGRDHVKNSPPCARCGSPDLAKTEQTYADVERDLATPSWAEVAKPYVPAIGIIVLVVTLAVLGVIPVPGLEGTDGSVPGEGESAAGYDLDLVAVELYTEIEAERETRPTQQRSLDGGVGAYATVRNRNAVVEAHGGTVEYPVNTDEFDLPCEDDSLDYVHVPTTRSIDDSAFDDESDIASTLFSTLYERASEDSTLETVLFGESEYDGIDVHVDGDDLVHVTVATC